MNDERRRELLEERVLELLLERSDADARELELLRADPDAAATVERLERFLVRCRHELAAEVAPAESAPAESAPAEVAPAESALVDSVLARTTREDPGWRGDLRLVRGFVARRLRSSVWLRVAAASLLVHVAALPVAAWFAFQAREPSLSIDFRPATESPLAPDAAEPERDLGEAPGPDELDSLLGGGAWGVPSASVENNLRRARFWLLAGAVPQPTGDARSSVGALLDERARRLDAREATWDDDPRRVDDPLERVLVVETLLDGYVLSGRVPPHLERGLRSLNVGDGAVGQLARAALARAAAYGCPDAGPSVVEPDEPPYGPRWRADLRAALDGREDAASDPAVRAWLEPR